MITLTLTESEASAVQRVVDAALKGSGVLILQEAAFLQTKLKQACDEYKQSSIKVSSVMDEPKT